MKKIKCNKITPRTCRASLEECKCTLSSSWIGWIDRRQLNRVPIHLNWFKSRQQNICFRGLNPTEMEVQDVINRVDMDGTGKVESLKFVKC